MNIEMITCPTEGCSGIAGKIINREKESTKDVIIMIQASTISVDKDNAEFICDKCDTSYLVMLEFQKKDK